MTELNEIIAALEDEWELETGFLGRLRASEFDRLGLERLLVLLRAIPKDWETFPRRLVSLLWYIPIFMEWQRENLEASGYDTNEYSRYSNQINELIESILGVP